LWRRGKNQEGRDHRVRVKGLTAVMLSQSTVGWRMIRSSPEALELRGKGVEFISLRGGLVKEVRVKGVRVRYKGLIDMRISKSMVGRKLVCSPSAALYIYRYFHLYIQTHKI
jgi:hypothetical protein